jgi:hypothetical protein
MGVLMMIVAVAALWLARRELYLDLVKASHND